MTDLRVAVRGELSLSGNVLQALLRGSEGGSAALRAVVGNVEINVGALLVRSTGDTRGAALRGAGDAIPTPSCGVGAGLV